VERYRRRRKSKGGSLRAAARLATGATSGEEWGGKTIGTHKVGRFLLVFGISKSDGRASHNGTVVIIYKTGGGGQDAD
jgi:hypothetical protein